MSRFVTVETALRDREGVLAGLKALGLAVDSDAAAEAVMLRGSIECAGEPVELRVEAGALGSVEDFGLRRGEDGGYVLVCSEHDRALLARALLPPLRVAVARARVDAAARAAGLTVEALQEAEGPLRLIVRRGGG
jgi:hypothetical protein